MLYKDFKKEIYGGEYNTTVNKMELTACIKAIECLKTRQHPIVVYSDSAYVVNCMNKQWYNKWRNNGWKNCNNEDVKNQDLWEKLVRLNEKFKIKFVKVKSHAGIKYNEVADELAAKGRIEIGSN